MVKLNYSICSKNDTLLYEHDVNTAESVRDEGFDKFYTITKYTINNTIYVCLLQSIKFHNLIFMIYS